MESMSRLKVGIVGAGLITREKHLPAFINDRKHVEVSALCDLNLNIANKLADEFHVKKVYSGIEEMLKAEDLDIVDICVPPLFHGDIALMAIEKGCNILIEKPMALSSKECDSMIAAAEKNKVKICVVHNDLFHPPYSTARRIINEGAIGEFIGMHIWLSTPYSEMLGLRDHWYHRLPGGMVYETAPHVAYLAQDLIGPISDVAAFPRSIRKMAWAKFDDFLFVLQGPLGMSYAYLNYTHDYRMAKIDVIGDKASLEIDFHKMTLIKRDLKTLKFKDIGRSIIKESIQYSTAIGENALKVILRNKRIGTEILIQRFIESINNNVELPVTAENGRATVAAVEKMIESLNNVVS
jgi:predicted dehydrogenase